MERGHYFPSKNPFDKALTKAVRCAGVSARRVEWVDKKKCSGRGVGIYAPTVYPLSGAGARRYLFTGHLDVVLRLRRRDRL